MATIETHPVQTNRDRQGARIRKEVALAAYEVYCEVFRPQPAMIDLAGRNCRGGFGAGELIAFLYARAFPKAEWDKRFHEALEGMQGL